MESLDDCRTELVIDSRALDHGYALNDRGSVEAGSAYRLAVALQAVLDVHGDVVDLALGDDASKHLGPSAVRVELDQVAQVLHPCDEVGKVVVDSRLSSCYDEAVEHAVPLPEEGEELILVDDGLGQGVEDQ